MGRAMKIMDHGSGSGLAKAMKVKMPTTAQRQPLIMVLPFMSPSMLRATSSSGRRKAIPKTSTSRMTNDRYRLAPMTPAVGPSGMKPVRITTACGMIHMPRATPEENRMSPARP